MPAAKKSKNADKYSHYKVKQVGSVMHWELTIEGPKDSPF